MRTVLASNNPAKLNELQQLFGGLHIELVSQRQLDVASVPETGATFVENAIEKARHVSAAVRLPAIADDSGLVVEALQGAPGLFSARYAGEGATDQANNARLVSELAGVDQRAAYFYCALVFMKHTDDPAPLVATAAWHGQIIDVPRGSNGFGYDPHFYLEALGKTSAELSTQEKHRLSHRGQAARKLAEQLRRALAAC